MAGADPRPSARQFDLPHDLAPWNLVRNDERWVFIDWDSAGPSSRLWDLAYAANAFVLFRPGGDVEVDGQGLRALVGGYGLDSEQRRALPAQIAGHTRGMYDLLVRGSRTGEQPWAQLHAEGHADVWGPAADYIEETTTHGSRRSFHTTHILRRQRLDRPANTSIRPGRSVTREPPDPKRP